MEQLYVVEYISLNLLRLNKFLYHKANNSVGKMDENPIYFLVSSLFSEIDFASATSHSKKRPTQNEILKWFDFNENWNNFRYTQHLLLFDNISATLFSALRLAQCKSC